MTSSVSAIRSGGRLVDVMRQLAGGVCVITAGRAPTRTGYTGTAVFSLSVEPERVTISVGRSSSSYPVIRDTGAFGLNILRWDQQHIADRFAGRGGVKGEARYAGAEWVAGPSGVSLLVAALASADCAVEEVIERHSHALIIGEPLSLTANHVDDALIFWRSRYASSRAVGKVAAE